ncbi:MAG: dual specificity protein phosphatase family protein [Actinobacteria bacterium]|nr:dual specificity protein phosphatase family protein [Actinomycetota bacterium]
MDAPLADSFWIEPGRLLAGTYAGAADEAQAHRRLQALAAAGITLIVDLTHADDGVSPYAQLLPPSLRRLHVPIPDFHAPSLAGLERALAAIDTELVAGGAVYVHCLGGCGRTGTVVAGWLVRQGASAAAALERFAELSLPVCGRPCPERAAQSALVRAYAAARAGSNTLD